VVQEKGHERVIDIAVAFRKVVIGKIDPDSTGGSKGDLWGLHLNPIHDERLMGGGMLSGVPPRILDEVIG
jgi:hypothetical protein